MPHLTSGHLWRASGRLETMGPELITFEDRARRVQVLSCTVLYYVLCTLLRTVLYFAVLYCTVLYTIL